MHKYAKRITKNMNQKELYEAGIQEKPKGYEIFKMFSPHAFVGSGGRYDSAHLDSKKTLIDKHIIQKFYQRFPALRIMPNVTNVSFKFGSQNLHILHPAVTYLKKYKDLLKKGYSENKAFEIVEQELNVVFENQRDDMRILRGAALAEHGDSYLDRAQRVAELESQLKLQRFVRDIPKFQRGQDQSWLDQQDQNRDSIEDVMALKPNVKTFDIQADYTPVLYSVVKDPVALQTRESLSQIQQDFLTRTEKLLRQHQQRSHIHDGLKNLSNADIIQKVTEGPTKLKKQAQSFLHLLRKHGVRLDSSTGEVDYSKVKEKNVVDKLKQKESLVKVTLMQADLEFEYPQKLEKLLVRSDVLRWLDEEEEKMKQMAIEAQDFIQQAATLPGQVAKTMKREKILTYENYYGISDDITKGQFQTRQQTEQGKISFEQFVSETASENIFDNDLLEQQYKFWETIEDREMRLKKIWIDLKRKNALGGIDATTQEEHVQFNADITSLIRKIRWRVDQELTRRNIEPLFKDNYAGKYDKEEFLLDSDMEFYKIKKLLDRNPKLLKDDPVISIDYLKIISLIKQKKMLEQTSDPFNAENSVQHTWNDLEIVERDRKSKSQQSFERYQRKQLMENDQVDYQDTMSLGTGEEETEEAIKSDKKKELKEHQKIIQQFDKLATQFERTSGSGSTVKSVGKQGGKPVEETASMLKKKSVKRKEKSLSAKLRLKEKKTKV